MRPKQINVFDGLRITTEHLDHLQGAFLTGLQDLRETAGLGRVVRGFEVAAEGVDRITVQPGLAFDLEKNRITIDEPKTVDAAFREGEEVLWVTIRYDQQESGEVEGKPTLIWDGCALELSPEKPGPDNLAIAIARLTLGEGGTLVVSRPDEPETDGEMPGGAPPEGQPPEGQPPEGEPSPAAENGNAAPSENGSAAEDAQPVEGADANGGADGANGGSNGGAASVNGGTTAAVMPRLAAARGMLRFANPASPFGSPLASLAAAVRAQAGQAAEAQPGALPGALPDPSLTLAAGDLPLAFAPVSLSCQVILTASTVTGGAETGASENGAASTGGLHSTSWGEVVLNGENLSQHGLTQCGQGHINPGPLLAEGIVAQLPFSAWAEPAPREAREGAPAAEELAACRYLQLSVRAVRREPQQVQLTLSLDWKGGYEEDRIHLLETASVRFQTEALLAWTAFGSA